MKRTTLFFALLLLVGTLASATKRDVKVDYKHLTRDNLETKVHRSPERLPDISVIYDTDTHSVEVSCMEVVDAEVFLLDTTGNIIDYSPYLNTTLSTNDATVQSFTIIINGENWSASAEICL